MSQEMARRPLKSRSSKWAPRLAFALVKMGLTPNQISVASVIFSLLAGGCFFLSQNVTSPARAALLVGAAVCIQSRLVCNLLDGLMAVEGGLKSKTGDIFNDLPDRVADVAILVSAGYAIHTRYAMELGWAAAVGAVLTAYVRVLGGALGIKQDYCGPMAKQHRMFALTVACIAWAGETLAGLPPRAMPLALGLIIAGTILTSMRRAMRIAAALHAR